MSMRLNNGSTNQSVVHTLASAAGSDVSLLGVAFAGWFRLDTFAGTTELRLAGIDLAAGGDGLRVFISASGFLSATRVIDGVAQTAAMTVGNFPAVVTGADYFFAAVFTGNPAQGLGVRLAMARRGTNSTPVFATPTQATTGTTYNSLTGASLRIGNDTALSKPFTGTLCDFAMWSAPGGTPPLADADITWLYDGGNMRDAVDLYPATGPSNLIVCDAMFANSSHNTVNNTAGVRPNGSQQSNSINNGPRALTLAGQTVTYRTNLKHMYDAGDGAMVNVCPSPSSPIFRMPGIRDLAGGGGSGGGTIYANGAVQCAGYATDDVYANADKATGRIAFCGRGTAVQMYGENGVFPSIDCGNITVCLAFAKLNQRFGPHTIFQFAGGGRQFTVRMLAGGLLRVLVHDGGVNYDCVTSRPYTNPHCMIVSISGGPGAGPKTCTIWIGDERETLSVGSYTSTSIPLYAFGEASIAGGDMTIYRALVYSEAFDDAKALSFRQDCRTDFGIPLNYKATMFINGSSLLGAPGVTTNNRHPIAWLTTTFNAYGVRAFNYALSASGGPVIHVGFQPGSGNGLAFTPGERVVESVSGASGTFWGYLDTNGTVGLLGLSELLVGFSNAAGRTLTGQTSGATRITGGGNTVILGGTVPGTSNIDAAANASFDAIAARYGPLGPLLDWSDVDTNSLSTSIDYRVIVDTKLNWLAVRRAANPNVNIKSIVTPTVTRGGSAAATFPTTAPLLRALLLAKVGQGIDVVADVTQDPVLGDFAAGFDDRRAFSPLRDGVHFGDEWAKRYASYVAAAIARVLPAATLSVGGQSGRPSGRDRP